jgi:hypothetical protein
MAASFHTVCMYGVAEKYTDPAAGGVQPATSTTSCSISWYMGAEPGAALRLALARMGAVMPLPSSSCGGGGQIGGRRLRKGGRRRRNGESKEGRKG